MEKTSIHDHDNLMNDIPVSEEEFNESKASMADKKQKKKNKKQAATDRSGYSTTFYLHALLLFGGRLLHKALNFYNSLFELSSQEKAKIYRNISTHYANKGNYDKSLDHLKDWVKLEPSNQDAHYQLGLALSATGNHGSAIRSFEIVLKLNPDHKGSIYHKSILLIKMKNFEKALEGLKKLCDITENAKVYYNMSIAYDGLGQVDLAIESLEKAVAIDPDEIKYHQYLGFLNVRNDDHKKAANYFTKVMELERERDDDF